MKYLANIYTEHKKDANTRVLNFINVLSPSEYQESVIPSLIIGKKTAENLFPANCIKVLDKKINDNTSWTFSRNEHRNEYERDIEAFQNKVYEQFIRKLQYIYLDIFTMTYSDFKEILKLLNSSMMKVVFISGTMLYIFIDGNEAIYGFSLTDTEYIGIPKKKIALLFKGLPNCKFIKDDEFLTEKTKKKLKNAIFSLPFLFFNTL